MADQIYTAMFVYSPEGEHFLEKLREHRIEATIHGIPLEKLLSSPEIYLETINRVIVAADLEGIKKVLKLAEEFRFSVGFIPLASQKTLAVLGGIPTTPEESFDLALSTETREINFVYCNDQIVLFQAALGDIPLIANSDNIQLLKIVIDGFKKLKTLQLKPITISTNGENQRSISTAACGCIVLHNPWTIASRLIAHENRMTEAMVSMVVTAPLSIVDYIQFLWRIFSHKNETTLPKSIGFVKSREIRISQAQRFSLTIDGEPQPVDSDTLVFKASETKIAVCTGRQPEDESTAGVKPKERFETASLPRGREIDKAVRKHLPFFPYASEERFKELFLSLRSDARIDSKYLVLMLLSTLIATFGLYLDSSSVIIGAMLLAPLMAPIISAAMGVLRSDQAMIKNSAVKILVGICIAVSTGALITLIMPYQPITGEMQGRLNPTVLDLLVAVFAGVAGAYTKSFKEILQSLAGVAIAVALVPPLATAGIGLGRLDIGFFGHAFLLFTTNLAGILTAAVISFRWLGFSSAVQSKGRFALVVCFLFLISIPLYRSYNKIVEQSEFERSWQVERFLVNGKYIIVNSGKISYQKGNRILNLQLLAREQLDRADFQELKRKIKRNFGDDIILRTQLTYIP